MVMAPILRNKFTSKPSVFAPAALLREARRQKGLGSAEAPPVCILDPDGDLVRQLRKSGAASPFADWPCYHTELDTFELSGRRVGIVGRVVGASFAVLVAEELFASGCKLLVSLTSAGQITPAGSPPYFVVIDKALLAHDPVNVHPLVNDRTTAIAPGDLLKFIESCGHRPQVLDLDG